MSRLAALFINVSATSALGFVLLGLLIFAWASFLEVHGCNPTRVRSTMLSILAVAMSSELAFSISGLTQSWVAAVVLVVNIWGWLDALLRFPTIHGISSGFAAKQFLLLVIKTLSYAFGIVSLKQHLAKFLMMMLINIWGLPVLYLMALPFHPAQRVATDGRDVDLVVRLWHISTCRVERQKCARSCRTWLQKGLVMMSQRSPMIKLAVCAASPACRRNFSKGRRMV